MCHYNTPYRIPGGWIIATNLNLLDVIFRYGVRTINSEAKWDLLSYMEKNRVLYLKQKELLDTLLEKKAISKEQYEKSLHDLTEKMRITINADSVSD